MYPQKVKFISVEAPFHTVEGAPYGKKKINFNQPLSFIASDIAAYFGGNLYGYEFDEQANSMLVVLTNGYKVRIQFKEQRHDEHQQGQEQAHYQRGKENSK